MNSSGTVYHLGINGVQSGPFTKEDILARFARGELTGAELCWTEGWKNWRPLSQTFPDAVPAAAIDAPPPLPPLTRTSASASAPRAAAPVQVRIEGKSLVVPKNADFPRVCIRTGSTEDLIARPLRLPLSWHHPAVFLAVLLNILIYLVIALITRKTSTHTVYLTRAARASQVKWHLANWGLFLGFWILLGCAFGLESGLLGLFSVATFVASVIIYFKKVRLLHASKIEGNEVRIAGIPPAVMEQLVAAWK